MAMQEELLRRASDTIYQYASRILRQATKRITDASRIRSASHRYAAAYLARYGYIKILGMAEPAPLQNVFTDVRFASPAYLTAIRSVEGLEEAFRARGERRLFLTAGTRHDGL